MDLSQSFNILEHVHLPWCGDDLYDQEFFDYVPQLVSCLLMLVSEVRQPWRAGDRQSSFDSPCEETKDRSAFFWGGGGGGDADRATKVNDQSAFEKTVLCIVVCEFG